MSRVLKLLSGDRTAATDMRMLRADRFALDPRTGEVDKFTIDAERWLDAATLSTCTSNNTAYVPVVATPLVTVTYTAPTGYQVARLTFTASDGRKRMIDFVTMLDPQDYTAINQDYSGSWYGGWGW